MSLSKQLFEIALESRELFLKGFCADKDVNYKGTVDLVTQFDVAIEKQLTAKLRETFPEYTVIGEENTKDITYPTKAIYIDPIDGTTNFVHGIEHCAMSLGMWSDGVPIAAIVYNPVLDECFSADVGKGAYLNGKRLSVSAQSLLQQSLLATGFPYTKVQKGKDYEWVLKCMANLLPITRDIRRFGAASLDLCYLAKGKFDAYYECNLKPWDVAAGILILQEAGGKVTNEKGEPYTLDNHIFVASNSLVHDALLEQL
jgi:myo-inositol-1(or 4)-monophosphatase